MDGRTDGLQKKDRHAAHLSIALIVKPKKHQLFETFSHTFETFLTRAGTNRVSKNKTATTTIQKRQQRSLFLNEIVSHHQQWTNERGPPRPYDYHKHATIKPNLQMQGSLSLSVFFLRVKSSLHSALFPFPSRSSCALWHCRTKQSNQRARSSEFIQLHV